MTHRKHTTVVEVLDLLKLHELVDVADRVVMCRCGRWFDAPAAFSGHLRGEAMAQLSASQPRAPRITREILAQVAAIHRGAPDGEKTGRVAAFLGVSPRSAGTYITRARKVGLLDTADRAA